MKIDSCHRRSLKFFLALRRNVRYVLVDWLDISDKRLQPDDACRTESGKRARGREHAAAVHQLLGSQQCNDTEYIGIR